MNILGASAICIVCNREQECVIACVCIRRCHIKQIGIICWANSKKEQPAIEKEGSNNSCHFIGS